MVLGIAEPGKLEGFHKLKSVTSYKKIIIAIAPVSLTIISSEVKEVYSNPSKLQDFMYKSRDKKGVAMGSISANKLMF